MYNKRKEVNSEVFKDPDGITNLKASNQSTEKTATKTLILVHHGKKNPDQKENTDEVSDENFVSSTFSKAKEAVTDVCKKTYIVQHHNHTYAILEDYHGNNNLVKNPKQNLLEVS